MDLADHILKLEAALNRQLAAMTFSAPVSHVYNPLLYADAPHQDYVRRYARPRPKALLLGMNPGPFGMAQTGVPFGEVSSVKTWLAIDQPVGQPERVHPKRPIQGFQCARSEVSGQRLWTWAQQRWGQPERFFDDCYVHNFCPLIFMADSGRNITPDKLVREEREAVYAACEASLADLVSLVQPECIVAVGVFAEARARSSCAEIPVHKMPHPSPASPAANRGWSDLANAVFDDLGIGERP